MPYSKKRAESCSEKPLFWIFVYKIHSSLGPTLNTKGPRAKPPPPQNAHSREMPRAWLSWGQREGTAENGRHELLKKTHGHTGGPSGHRSTVTRTQGWNHHPQILRPRWTVLFRPFSPGSFPLRGALVVQSTRPSLMGVRGGGGRLLLLTRTQCCLFMTTTLQTGAFTYTQGKPHLKENHYTTHLPITTSLFQIFQILPKAMCSNVKYDWCCQIKKF